MKGVRAFLRTKAGKVIGTIGALTFVAVAVTAVVHYLRGGLPSDAYYTTYVCSETGKSFKHRNQLGDEIPILSPYSGKATGYPGEACFWTANGEVKSDPSWVLLNLAIGKDEPTFCPDCGRLVVGHNPRPQPGRTAPPTEKEYWDQRGGKP